VKLAAWWPVTIDMIGGGATIPSFVEGSVLTANISIAPSLSNFVQFLGESSHSPASNSIAHSLRSMRLVSQLSSIILTHGKNLGRSFYRIFRLRTQLQQSMFNSRVGAYTGRLVGRSGRESYFIDRGKFAVLLNFQGN
jgi:hypothetical protein